MGTMSLYRRIALLTLAVLTGCKPSGTGSGVKTDLVDNADVGATFEQWKTGSMHCSFKDGAKRAIATGFSLFGAKYNISGIVAMSLAKPDFWLQDSKIDGAATAEQADKFFRHDEITTVAGGYVTQRTLKIDGQEFEVCFLYLDVQWDLAAAIILHEAATFRPDLIVMSGMNGSQPQQTFFESGAVNNAQTLSGYEANGKPDGQNIPKDGEDYYNKVLPGLPLGKEVKMTWDAEKLALVNTDLIAAINPTAGYTSVAAPIRVDNAYICNNVSISVTTAMTGTEVKLAGGNIVIKGMDFGTQVGFLHYPSKASKAGTADNGQQVYGWVRVLANTIKTAIGTETPESIPSGTPIAGEPGETDAEGAGNPDGAIADTPETPEAQTPDPE